MFNLLRMIHAEQIEIEKQLAEEDEQVRFYENFFKNSDYGNIKDLLKADRVQLAVAIIMTNHPELDVNYVTEVVERNRPLFESISESKATELSVMLYSLRSSGMYNIVKKTFAKGKEITVKDILFQKGGAHAYLLQNTLSELNVELTDFVSFMDLFVYNDDNICEAIVTAITLKQIAEEREFYEKDLEDFTAARGIKVHNKKQTRMINSRI